MLKACCVQSVQPPPGRCPVPPRPGVVPQILNACCVQSLQPVPARAGKVKFCVQPMQLTVKFVQPQPPPPPI
jgi:hypothetical protein